MASSVFMLNAFVPHRLRSSRHKTAPREAPNSKKGSHANEPHHRLSRAAEPRTDKALSPPALASGPPPAQIVSHCPPAKDTLPAQPQWRLQFNFNGSKECLILGLVANMAIFEFVAPENALLRPLLCLVHCLVVAVAFYSPASPTRVENVPGTHVVECADPVNCCLHRAAEAFHGKKAHAAPEQNGVTRQPQSSVGKVKRLPLGVSMAQSQPNASGNASKTPHSYARARAETFLIRSQDYKKSKRKVASQAAVFEFIGADLLRTNGRHDLISQRMELPKEYANDKVFIINAQVPSDAPSLWGDAGSGGPGFTLALCWRIPQDVCEELKDPKSKELRLLKRFLEAGNDASLTDRFKVIAQVTNQDQCGLTGMAKKLLVSHNSTPVLTRPQHRIHHFNEGSTEIVVDIHAFSYIARRGIHMLLDKCANLVIDVAFVLQGETEDELPERILGCCRLDSVDITKAMDLPR